MEVLFCILSFIAGGLFAVFVTCILSAYLTRLKELRDDEDE